MIWTARYLMRRLTPLATSWPRLPQPAMPLGSGPKRSPTRSCEERLITAIGKSFHHRSRPPRRISAIRKRNFVIRHGRDAANDQRCNQKSLCGLFSRDSCASYKSAFLSVSPKGLWLSLGPRRGRVFLGNDTGISKQITLFRSNGTAVFGEIHAVSMPRYSDF
jgi:hypothetical protein